MVLNCDFCKTIVSKSLNLSTTFAKYSKCSISDLISSFLSCELFKKFRAICKKCLNLLHEYDRLQVRSRDIENTFKNYLQQTSAVQSNYTEEVTLEEKLDIKSLLKIETVDATENTNEPADTTNLESKPNIYICDVCGREYKPNQKRYFIMHMNYHKDLYKCKFCDKSFSQKACLERHIPIHTGDSRYQCEICGKKFVHDSSLKIHKVSHTGIKPFKCTICNLNLSSKSHLRRHMRIHTGEKNHVCDICGKLFAEKYNLNAHKKMHKLEPQATIQFDCQICGKSYDRQSKLESHLVNDHGKINITTDS